MALMFNSAVACNHTFISFCNILYVNMSAVAGFGVVSVVTSELLILMDFLISFVVVFITGVVH